MRKLLPLMALALLMIAGGDPARGDPAKIRYGWVIVPAGLLPVMHEKPGLLPHDGKTYELEFLHFTGTSLETTALASDQIDIGGLSFSAIGLAIQNAKLDDLRIIADEPVDGADGYFTSQYMVLKDSPIRSVDDLKGKVLADNAIGAALDIAMRALLRRHDLEDKKDYRVVEVPFPSMKAVLLDHKADLVTAVPPFVYDEGLMNSARTLFTLRDAFQGPTELGAWTTRAPFIAKNHAALIDLLEDYLRAVRWFNDPANHNEVVDLTARFTKSPAAEYAGWLLTNKDTYRSPTGRPDMAAMQSNLDHAKAAGFLSIDIDAKAHTDTTLVEEAAKRLD